MMLSRVAENLYWMSRQIERADNLARLVVAHQNELLDATQAVTGSSSEWHPMLEVTLMGDAESAEDVVTYMVSSRENPDSIFQCVRYARENARAARDQVTDDMWVKLNSLYLDLSQLDPLNYDDQSKICNRVIEFSYSFRGMAYNVLARTEPWLFIRLGESIEKADKTSRLMDLPNFLPGESEASAWNTLLKASGATAARRQQLEVEINRSNAISLLLFSPSFPRSIRYCAGEMNTILHQISNTNETEYQNEAERAAGAFLARMNFSGVEDLGRLGLHDYIDSIQCDLNKIGTEISKRYFSIRRDISFVDASTYVEREIREQQEQQQQQ